MFEILSSEIILKATYESIYMVSISLVFAIGLGVPLGILLAETRKQGVLANSLMYTVLQTLINILRSVPFIILLVAILPFTRLVVGTSIGTTAAIVPLTLYIDPFMGRLIEQAILEIPPTIIECAKTLGANRLEIILYFILPEARPAIILAITNSMIGLINAYHNFDSSQGTKFSTYAYYYVQGEVKKYVRESGLVKVSSDLIKLNQSIEKVREHMSQKLGREPSITELSLFLEVDEEKIEEARVAALDVKSLDYSFEDDSTELYNSVASYDRDTDPRVLDLKTEISKLPEEEKHLIVARYFDDMTQSEASRELGISQVQVSRKEGKILEKLRCNL